MPLPVTINIFLRPRLKESTINFFTNLFESSRENPCKSNLLIFFFSIIFVKLLFSFGEILPIFLVKSSQLFLSHFDPQSHLEQINKLLSQRPDDPSLLAQVSRIYMMVGKFELAVESARRLVERGSHAAQSSRSPP